ncbi:MAG: 2-amino-4-hydroxy-6-hydroxymethyldihydropteridine diphosphokinase, partial [Actinobacteria bacterium RBG_19FT_COMBO_70_19]
MTTAYLGLGANLGDRLANLQRAVDLLAEVSGLRVARSSRVYETEPVGGPEQPEYLNAVVEAETDLAPHDLLEVCLSVETRMGRVRAEPWGPRTIDVDVLTYGDETIDEPDLVVPHPRMHERGFVLVPLAELTGDPPLPGGLRLASLRLGPSVVAAAGGAAARLAPARAERR